MRFRGDDTVSIAVTCRVARGSWEGEFLVPDGPRLSTRAGTLPDLGLVVREIVSAMTGTCVEDIEVALDADASAPDTPSGAIPSEPPGGGRTPA